MDIRQATLSDLSIIKRISEVTISEIYPHYYPKGAVDFFLEHHSKDIEFNIIAAGDNDFLCYDVMEKQA